MEFVPLVCPQCGGKIELTKAQYDDNFMLSDVDGMVIFIGTQPKEEGAICTHCHTEFARKTRFEKHAEGASFFSSINGDGNVVVQGYGNKVIINTGPGAVATDGAMAAGKGGSVYGKGKKGGISIP